MVDFIQKDYNYLTTMQNASNLKRELAERMQSVCYVWQLYNNFAQVAAENALEYKKDVGVWFNFRSFSKYYVAGARVGRFQIKLVSLFEDDLEYSKQTQRQQNKLFERAVRNHFKSYDKDEYSNITYLLNCMFACLEWISIYSDKFDEFLKGVKLSEAKELRKLFKELSVILNVFVDEQYDKLKEVSVSHENKVIVEKKANLDTMKFCFEIRRKLGIIGFASKSKKKRKGRKK